MATEIEPDEDATPGECLEEAAFLDEDRRAWAETITEFLKSRFNPAGSFIEAGCHVSDDHIDGRVRYALDMAAIAACERLVRIFNSDVAPSHGEDA